MAYFKQGQFEPKNPRKYVGQRVPIYRSSWEAAFMQFCDTNPNIIAWSSEPVKIPYRNPFTGKYTGYVPDFLSQLAEHIVLQLCRTHHKELHVLEETNRRRLQMEKCFFKNVTRNRGKTTK